MNKKIKMIKGFRLYLLKQIEDLTVQQLNTIPNGFNNNIIWNLGNLIYAVQNMCYARTGLPFSVSDNFFLPFMPGTRPVKIYNEQQIKELKEVFITSMDKLQSDFDENIFQNYAPSPMIASVYGFEVNNIDDAFEYLLYHEGLHGGYILSLKHLV
jgi:DinB superfamily